MNAKIKLAGLLVFLGFAFAAYEFYGFISEEGMLLAQKQQALDAQFANKQAEYQKLRSFVQNIETIKGELRELGLQLKSALDYMPPEFKMGDLLRRLTGLAHNSGVELVRFSPDADEHRVEGTFYATTNIGFEIEGGFTQCLLFLDQVSRLRRIINVSGINIAPIQTGDESLNNRTGVVRSQSVGTFVTYRFIE